MTIDTTVPPAVHDLARRVFAPTSIQSIERMTRGVSTYVYRTRTESETFYLRVWPEEGESFAPEARVHELLRRTGVKAPEVIYLEDCNEALERSVMVTTEIPGEQVGPAVAPHEIRAILLEAGRDLAVINSIEVDGFGWIRRDTAPIDRLQGELPTYQEFVLEHLEPDLETLRQTSFTPATLASIRETVDVRLPGANAPQAHLAHGDFDVSHIYHQDGQYTGIIDFGEIRGTDRIYDLAHFNVHDGEVVSYPGLLPLLDGYRQLAVLPPDSEEMLHLSTLLIAVRILARTLNRPMQTLHQRCFQVIHRELAVLGQ